MIINYAKIVFPWEEEDFNKRVRKSKGSPMLIFNNALATAHVPELSSEDFVELVQNVIDEVKKYKVKKTPAEMINLCLMKTRIRLQSLGYTKRVYETIRNIIRENLEQNRLLFPVRFVPEKEFHIDRVYDTLEPLVPFPVKTAI